MRSRFQWMFQLNGLRPIVFLYVKLRISANPSAMSSGRFQVPPQFACSWLGLWNPLLHTPITLLIFNAFAVEFPVQIVVDSDLDWGQDLDRLLAELNRLKIDFVHIAYFGSADLTRHEFPKFDCLAPNRNVGVALRSA